MALKSDHNKHYHLRKKLAGKTDEEKLNEIKEIAFKEKLSYWRAHCLKAYRDKELGNFSTDAVV